MEYLRVLAVFVLAISLSTFVLQSLRGPGRKRRVERGVEAARLRLRGLSALGLSMKVDQIFWYGAIDINAKHLVVWILLEGPDALQVPPYFDPTIPRKDEMSVIAADWLRTLADVVREELRTAGWRTPVAVAIESTQRVARGGGFVYFK